MEKPYYQSIVDALKLVKRPGTYAAGGEIVMPLPAIKLAGKPNTIVGLPLGEAQAKHLIELASRAPFGRGEQTIVDTSVRSTWQLDPTQFSITNPQWEKRLQLLLPRVKTELGCDPKMNVTCQLYKLLLYEPGGHFKKHRDTEKAEGMFGTLVIQLPSDYSGGKLIVYHHGKKSEFDYSGPDCCGNCYFTSFYADCQHEVEKVTKGYRSCLIYNLMYQGLDECPTPIDNQAQVSAIVSAMKQWQEDVESSNCPETMTYLLEHKYCEASLSFRLLKNGDRAVADLLAHAKAKVDFDVYVGHIKFTEHWAADYYRGQFEEIECCDESVSAKHLKSSDGERTIAEIDIYMSSFVPEDFFDAIDPDEKEYKEATGNEGATIDKQYNWTALLLWPIKKRMAVIGVDNVIKFFKQDLDASKKDLDDVAREILREIRHARPSVQSGLIFLDALQAIGDAKLIAEMLDVIAAINGFYRYDSFIEDATFCSSITSIGQKHGWDIFSSPFQTMFAKCSSDNVEKYCTFLKKMILSKMLGVENDLYANLFSIIVKFLADERDATERSPSPYMTSLYRYMGFDPPMVYRSKEFVCELFNLSSAVGTNDTYLSLTSALCSKPVRYPVQESLGPAVVDVCKSTKVDKDGPFHVILAYCISQLEAALQEVISAPANNVKPVELICSCDDCDELAEFLEHPTEVQHRFKISKNRRRHIHEQLENSGADATDTTERLGKPHTLVVTKNNASYDKEVKKQQKGQVLLVSLKALLPATDVRMPSEKEPPAKKKKDTSKVVAGSSSRLI